MENNYCNDCLKMIYSSLSYNAKKVLSLISEEDGLTRTEIERQTGLTYTISGNVIMELYHKQLLDKTKVKNTVLHTLTINGQKALEYLFEDDLYNLKYNVDKIVDKDFYEFDNNFLIFKDGADIEEVVINLTRVNDHKVQEGCIELFGDFSQKKVTIKKDTYHYDKQ